MGMGLGLPCCGGAPVYPCGGTCISDGKKYITITNTSGSGAIVAPDGTYELTYIGIATGTLSCPSGSIVATACNWASEGFTFTTSGGSEVTRYFHMVIGFVYCNSFGFGVASNISLALANSGGTTPIWNTSGGTLASSQCAGQSLSCGPFLYEGDSAAASQPYGPLWGALYRHIEFSVTE